MGRRIDRVAQQVNGGLEVLFRQRGVGLADQRIGCVGRRRRRVPVLLQVLQDPPGRALQRAPPLGPHFPEELDRPSSFPRLLIDKAKLKGGVEVAWVKGYGFLEHPPGRLEVVEFQVGVAQLLADRRAPGSDLRRPLQMVDGLRILRRPNGLISFVEGIVGGILLLRG